MVYLLFSVLCSTSLTLLFRMFKEWKVDNLQAIVVNYFVCVVLGAFLHGDIQVFTEIWTQPWLPLGITMGIFFIAGFLLMAITTQQLGVTVSIISQKMSLVVPVIVGIIAYNDTVTVLKIIALLLSLVAIYMSAKRKKVPGAEVVLHELYLPASVFAIAGCGDSLIKLAEDRYFQEENFNSFLIVLFGFAGVIGLIFLVARMIKHRQSPDFKSILAGIAIGVPNYGSIYFLMQTLKHSGMETSVVFPMNNIGIVIAASLLAFLIFREKLSLLNKAGIATAILVIVILSLES